MTLLFADLYLYLRYSFTLYTYLSLSLPGKMSPMDLSPVTCTADLLSKPRLVSEQKRNGNVKHITCQQILFGSGNETVNQVASEIMAAHPATYIHDEQFVKLTADCVDFRRRRGYHLSPLDQEEAKFSIAYNIIMHRHIEQVERLLRAIYRPQNVYCIHVDLNSPAEVHAGMLSLARCFPNVFIATKLEYVVYAGFSRLQADINCMSDHVKRDDRWRYLINVAGEAFPLRTNAEIVKILKIYNGANDIEGVYGRRIKRFRKLRKTGQKNPPIPHHFDVVKGSAYGIFSRAFVEFLLTDTKAKDLLQWSRKTYSPDEFYWSTLHHTYRNPHRLTPGAYSGEQGD
ncbi:hypothetical protein NP493_787g01058 [Ridgeia piscesae]|uniref:Beta-1,3-galactosyl-O-glycosyl-glycoprotein beta-1,6-N-acetylglucosaminyltransferase n=1 Tax=Ridgeia piscesae TaxID=27915 RepID=A0AAD9NLG1_RIDPI|nr:hypothetical protein NP493_787g01058 [Ridgeia piscesae]